MRVLIVEDDEVVASSLGQRVEVAMPGSACDFATCLSEAKDLIDSRPFDLAVVDLRIPASPGEKAEVAHGKAVETYLSDVQPGAFRVFLTASEASEVVDALRLGKTADFLHEGQQFCIVDYVLKEGSDSFDACVAKLAEHRDRLVALDSVELAETDGLSLDNRRAISIAVRMVGGVQGRVIKQLGHSASETALVECLGPSGAVVGNAFCKTGPPLEIQRESEGYKSAQHRLPTTAFPILSREVDVGVGLSRGLIFTKAPTSESFFDAVSKDPGRAAGVIDRLPGVLEPWTSDVETEEVLIEELIAPLIVSATEAGYADDLESLDLSRLAGVSISLRKYTQHGDLHGRNLFVTDENTPFLIDFAHSRPQHGPVDPVSLEMSMVFHPSSPLYGHVDVSLCTSWFDDTAIATVPGLSQVASSCRAWSLQNGHSVRDRALASLEYAVWILKHSEHPQHALAIAASAIPLVLAKLA